MAGIGPANLKLRLEVKLLDTKPKTSGGITNISLVRPPGYEKPMGGRSAYQEADLGLAAVVRALDLDGKHSRFVAALLSELNSDPAVIRYRQDVLADMLRLPGLVASLGEVLPQLGSL